MVRLLQHRRRRRRREQPPLQRTWSTLSVQSSAEDHSWADVEVFPDTIKCAPDSETHTPRTSISSSTSSDDDEEPEAQPAHPAVTKVRALAATLSGGDKLNNELTAALWDVVKELEHDWRARREQTHALHSVEERLYRTALECERAELQLSGVCFGTSDEEEIVFWERFNESNGDGAEPLEKGNNKSSSTKKKKRKSPPRRRRRAENGTITTITKGNNTANTNNKRNSHKSKAPRKHVLYRPPMPQYFPPTCSTPSSEADLIETPAFGENLEIPFPDTNKTSTHKLWSDDHQPHHPRWPDDSIQPVILPPHSRQRQEPDGTILVRIRPPPDDRPTAPRQAAFVQVISQRNVALQKAQHLEQALQQTQALVQDLQKRLFRGNRQPQEDVLEEPVTPRKKKGLRRTFGLGAKKNRLSPTSVRETTEFSSPFSSNNIRIKSLLCGIRKPEDQPHIPSLLLHHKAQDLMPEAPLLIHHKPQDLMPEAPGFFTCKRVDI
jgi:hypothetical protein